MVARRFLDKREWDHEWPQPDRAEGALLPNMVSSRSNVHVTFPC